MSQPAVSVSVVRQLRLLRDAHGDYGTYGKLTVTGGLSDALLRLEVLEEEWLQNRASVSCIPAAVGRYWVELHQRPSGVWTYEIMGVQPERDLILFHSGNTEEDTKGCVLTGLSRGMVHVKQDEDTKVRDVTKPGVLQSRTAFGLFMDAMGGVKTAPMDVLWEAGLP